MRIVQLFLKVDSSRLNPKFQTMPYILKPIYQVFIAFFMTNINRLCCNPKKKKIMFLLELNNRKD